MKFYMQILLLLIIIAVFWNVEVECKPRRQFRKIVNFEKTRLPIKHVSFQLKKVTPFGKYEVKHVINKRQTVLPEVPVAPVYEGSLDDIIEKKEEPLQGLEPKVIITSIVEPVDKSLLSSSVFDSRFLITPVEKPHEIVETPVKEVVAEPKVVEEVVAPVNIVPEPKEILLPPEPSVEPNVLLPKPKEILLPPEPPGEPNVLINTVIENLVPPPVRIPLYRNSNFPIPVMGNVGKTIMYTDITQIPLNVEPNPAPIVVPIAEAIPPPQPPPPPPVPLPPVIKEDPPPIKQETPNFFIKGSRLVLYVGSMMLQMLSRLVDRGFNINQIPIPIIPGM